MYFIPANFTVHAGRWVPLVVPVTVTGHDLGASTFRLQVRDRWNGGALRADLRTVTTAAAEGVRLGGVRQENGETISELAFRINESTMEAMPTGADPDGDVALVYDLQATIDGLPTVLMRGPFIVLAGATQ